MKRQAWQVIALRGFEAKPISLTLMVKLPHKLVARETVYLKASDAV